MKLSKKARNIIIAVLAVIAAAAYIYENYIKKPEEIIGEIQIHSIDVGQGDSTLIKAPEGNLLIDAGTNDSEDALLAYLDSEGVRVIDYFILTHPHEDHIGGADAVIENYTVKNVIMTALTTSSRSFENLLGALEYRLDTEVIEAKAGDEYSIGDMSFKLLGPVSEISEDDMNNTSVITRVKYGETSMLFTGDAEAEVEAELISLWGTELDCDFFKLAHHGSSTSNTDGFMDRVSPYIATVSCGEDNSYGHPHREIVSMLKKRGIEYYRTDELGSIVFVSDGVKIIKN